MNFNNRKYAILDTSETGSIDFSQVMETSADTLKFNLSGSQTFVKFEGDTPSFLEGKTSYTHREMLNKFSMDYGWEEREEEEYP